MALSPPASAAALSTNPGIGERFGRPTRRAINRDGSFNVRRRSH